jgi:predicted oxidoreductase
LNPIDRLHFQPAICFNARMKTQPIPQTDLVASTLIFGCMKIGGSWEDTPLSPSTVESATRSVKAGLDAGYTFFDHADIYCRGKGEQAFGEILKATPSLRDKIVLQSKCGIRPGGNPKPTDPTRYDFSYEHIVGSVEGSLKRLHSDRLDILLLHRPDALMEPTEVARAFDHLQKSGKVRYFGVSNFAGYQIDLLKTAVSQPLIANQVRLGLLHSGLIDAGTAVNQQKPHFTHPGEGTIEYCWRNRITIQAWSPLEGGKLSGGQLGHSDEARTLRAAELVKQMSEEKKVSREAIVLAWLLRHPVGIQPIIGTTSPERIQATAQAFDVTLTREEWYTLYTTARGEPMA